MEPRTNPARQKKPWVKPEVSRVKLTPDEVVLGSCKASPTSSSSAKGSVCRLCGISFGS